MNLDMIVDSPGGVIGLVIIICLYFVGFYFIFKGRGCNDGN